MCCNYSLLLKEFGTIIWKFACTYELEKRVLSYYSLQQNFCMVMWKFAWLCELVQRLKNIVVIHISFAQSCKIFAWSCKVGQRLIYHIFKAMKTRLFLAWFPCFCVNMQNGDEPLKLFFPLPHAFYPSEKSFKIQIKELRWIYLMETKRKIIKNQNSKKSRKMRNHWAS